MANTTGKKYGGRERGTPNKVTFELREKIKSFLELNIDGMQKDFDAIQEPEKRLLFMERLFAYVVPKGHAIILKDPETDKVALPSWLKCTKPVAVDVNRK